MWKYIFFHLPISLWCLFIDWTAPDIDNNGFLDSNDFECMALRACIIEGRGDCNPAKLAEYQHIMRSLWDEISDLADFDKVRYLKSCALTVSHAQFEFRFNYELRVIFMYWHAIRLPLITTNLDWFDMFTNCRPNFFQNKKTFCLHLLFFSLSRIDHFTGWQNLHRGI